MLQHIQQALPNAAGDVVVQKAQEVTPGQELPNPGHPHNQQQHHASGERPNIQNHHPDGLVPPPPPHHPHHGGRFNSHERDRVPPPKQGFHSGEITKNILRELFERKPNFSKERNPGGFFGPGGPPPGPSHPKVMNRPPIRPPPRPTPGGGIFSHGKEAALSTNDLNAEGGEIGPLVQYGPPEGAGAGGPWPNGPDVDMPKIVSLEVKCERSVMRVFVAFDKPFFGVIFSKVSICRFQICYIYIYIL